ncbi:MAG: hypothetical protein JWO35_786 [Candidatus Saccharibacteria bacterium]|nr:hypothetical protein [Candidatus Saccharibacteria bacterium]
MVALLWKGMSEQHTPFITLGNHLKYVREQSHQSLSEVSGAVEIDERSLERIEAGKERPAEDILLLLISHFGVQDREAVQLWELADYDSDVPQQIKIDNDSQLIGKPTVMVLAMDMRTMYSDGLEVITNNAGLTLNFTQMITPTQANSVAKVGMSYAQAEEVLRTLQQALLQARYQGGPKALPPSTERD